MTVSLDAMFGDLDLNKMAEIYLRSPVPVRWLSSAPPAQHERPYTELVTAEVIDQTETGLAVSTIGADTGGYLFIPWTNIAGVRQESR